jgi:thiol-disulfide isomerase/thioredoxin
MNDTATPRRSTGKMLALVVSVLAIISVAIYLMLDASRNDQLGTSATPAAGALPSEVARGAVAAFITHKAPRDLPSFTFQDADGRQLTMADWRGKNVLLNIWATWCAPCREEMPALSKLQQTYGGDDFEVVTISVDQKGIPVARAFLEEIGVDLPLYADPTTKTLSSLKGVGLPTTVLINAEGKETGRLLGPAVWDSPDAFHLIETALGRGPKPS